MLGASSPRAEFSRDNGRRRRRRRGLAGDRRGRNAGEFGDAESVPRRCARRNREWKTQSSTRVSTAAHAVDERRFSRFRRVVAAGEKSFAGADELEFIAQRFFAAGPENSVAWNSPVERSTRARP